MTRDADIGVVVVSHRSEESIDTCLTRLRASVGVVAIRVVDNASDDDTLAIVLRHAASDPRVQFIANPDNPGFAAACNQGAASLRDERQIVWLAFVNPDCFVEDDSLARLRTHARQLDGNALVGADLVDGSGVRDPAARRRDPEFRAMLRSRTAIRLAVPMDGSRSLQRVDAISGALMLLARILFDRVAGFDDGYRLHAEDLDFCRRIRAAGAVVAVANDVTVVHVRGVSSRSRPLFVEWHKHRGLWRYFHTFEAPHCSIAVRVLVSSLIWARFPFAAARAWRG